MPSFETLRNLVAECVASPHSSFYRELYGLSAGSVPHIDSIEDWQRLPYFTKDALLGRPMREYTYVAREDIDIIGCTSGTSGKPPLFCPRHQYTNSLDYRKRFYQQPGACLNSVVAQHRVDEFLQGHGGQPRTIMFDLKNVHASIALAQAAGVDSLGVHTFVVRTIGDEMQRIGIAQNIRLIDIIGETSSITLYLYMRQMFPNAKIISSYSLREAEGIVGIPCRVLSDEEPYPVYHVHPAFHIDLIDPETGAPLPVRSGVEAEVLVTDLNFPRALPLVRYRVGDTVRVLEERCKEHGQWTFAVLGKSDADFMLIPGGQLRADEVERVLREMPTIVTDHFELHRYDVGDSAAPKVRVVLKVELVDSQADLSLLAQCIQNSLRTSPTHTYADGVASGHYEPLECERLDTGPSTQKHKRMVRH